MALVIVGGMFAIVKARKETASTSDSTARQLRDDLKIVDELARFYRMALIKVELWVIEHMERMHDERFDPSTLYADD